MISCGGGGGGSGESASSGTSPPSSSTSAPTSSATTYNFGVSAIADNSTGVLCSYNYNAPNTSVTGNLVSTSAWTCNSSLRYLSATGIPDHTVGTFPNANNPNAINTQNVSWNMVLAPSKNASYTAIAPAGYAFNGVKFDPATAGSCPSGASSTSSCSLIGGSNPWDLEGIAPNPTFNFGLDSNNAHVQPNGAYHYHGMPTGILTEMNKGTAMTLVGFALDGFPIYARYGFSIPINSSSATKVMASSYQIKSSPSAGRPSVTTFPMGTFTQDYTFISGSGDLDVCNGRYGVTPEFPKGIYHYFITDSYPYIQRCIMGSATTSTGGPTPVIAN